MINEQEQLETRSIKFQGQTHLKYGIYNGQILNC